MSNNKSAVLNKATQKKSKPAARIQASAVSANGSMTFAKIREIAKSKGINTLRMKKADIIKAIQTAEGNFNCFGTAVSGYCDQQGCIWIDDCLGH